MFWQRNNTSNLIHLRIAGVIIEMVGTGVLMIVVSKISVHLLVEMARVKEEEDVRDMMKKSPVEEGLR